MAPAAAAAPTEGPAGLTHRQVLAILAGLMLAMFVGALDQTVVSTAIRVIGDDLQDLSAQAWVTTAFLVTSTLSTPIYGKLSDVYGRKPFLLAALGIFVVGSATCSIATSMYELAAFRAFQGLGAGGLFTLALAVVSDISSPRDRAKYQGYFIAVFGTSSVVGPLIGGALSGQDTILGVTGWRWIFLIDVPIGIAAVLVVTKVLHLPHTSRKAKVDVAGAAALLVALVPLLLVAEQGRTWGWASVGAIVCYVLAAIGIVSFLVVERRAGNDALIPFRLFSSRPFTLSVGQSVLVGVSMFGGITVLPLYLQVVKGASPTASGLLTLPMVGGIMLASVVSGQITSRTGRYKVFPVLGSALMVVGLFWLSRLGPDSSLVWADVGMGLVGLGLGQTMQTLTLAMQNAVFPADTGVATSSATFFRQIGGTLGVAVFLSLVYSLLSSRVASALAAAASDPAFVAARDADPAGYATLTNGQIADDTTLLRSLPEALQQPWILAYSASLDVVFLVASATMLVTLVLAIVTPEQSLRGSSEGTDPQPSKAADHTESPHPACPVALARIREKARDVKDKVKDKAHQAA